MHISRTPFIHDTRPVYVLNLMPQLFPLHAVLCFAEKRIAMCNHWRDLSEVKIFGRQFARLGARFRSLTKELQDKRYVMKRIRGGKTSSKINNIRTLYSVYQ
jgi:hypothetical protein